MKILFEKQQNLNVVKLIGGHQLEDLTVRDYCDCIHCLDRFVFEKLLASDERHGYRLSCSLCCSVDTSRSYGLNSMHSNVEYTLDAQADHPMGRITIGLLLPKLSFKHHVSDWRESLVTFPIIARMLGKHCEYIVYNVKLIAGNIYNSWQDLENDLPWDIVKHACEALEDGIKVCEEQFNNINSEDSINVLAEWLTGEHIDVELGSLLEKCVLPRFLIDADLEWDSRQLHYYVRLPVEVAICGLKDN